MVGVKKQPTKMTPAKLLPLFPTFDAVVAVVATASSSASHSLASCLYID